MRSRTFYSMGYLLATLAMPWPSRGSGCVTTRAPRCPSFCYGARTSGRGPGGETPRVADSSAAGAGRVFLNSILPSKLNRLGETPRTVSHVRPVDQSVARLPTSDFPLPTLLKKFRRVSWDTFNCWGPSLKGVLPFGIESGVNNRHAALKAATYWMCLKAV